MMSLSLHKLGRTFATRVHGIDLRCAPGSEQVEAIEGALAEYGVLHFPKQPMSENEQQTFISAFGPLTVIGAKEAMGKSRNFIDVGNVDDEGNVIPVGSAKSDFLRGNLLWHTDGSFNQPPIRVTDAACTHGQAWLTEEGQQGHRVQCPLHGGVFDVRTGAVVSPPCTVALRSYPARVDAGFVNLTAEPAENK